MFILKKSFKWDTVGFFSLSESKVIAKLKKKKLKQEFAQSLPTKIVQKKYVCLEFFLPKTTSPKIIYGKF